VDDQSIFTPARPDGITRDIKKLRIYRSVTPSRGVCHLTKIPFDLPRQPPTLARHDP